METASHTRPYSRRNPAPPKQRETRITIPERVGPHVKLLFTAMKKLNITYDDLETKSGVKRVCVKAWRHRNKPNLETLEAALSVVGYTFVPLPTERAIPAEVIATLRPAADALRMTLPDAIKLVSEIAYRDHHLSATLNEPT